MPGANTEVPSFGVDGHRALHRRFSDGCVVFTTKLVSFGAALAGGLMVHRTSLVAIPCDDGKRITAFAVSGCPRLELHKQALQFSGRQIVGGLGHCGEGIVGEHPVSPWFCHTDQS